MALKLDAVLFIYTEVAQVGHLFLFNALNEIPLLLNPFAPLGTVLEVVETCLLGLFVILGDLRQNGHLVTLHS